MLKFLIETEEHIEIERSELEFKQQVRISPLNMMVPDLYERLFVPGYIPAAEEAAMNDEVFFPTSDEDFEAMITEFEQEEAERERRGVFKQEA